MFGRNIAQEYTVSRWFEKFQFGYFNIKNVTRGRTERKIYSDKLNAVVGANTSQSTHELAARFDPNIPTKLSYLK